MLRFLIARVGAMVVMAVLATLVVFLIANTVPGDPVLAQLGDQAASDPAFVAEWRHQYGLDRPLWERYVIFLDGLRHGDFGRSIRSRRPVLDDVEEYSPATIELATVAFALTLLIGIPLGVAAAVKRDTWVDHLARAISLLGVSSPTFWLAFILLAVFYGHFEIAPGPGRLDPISLPPPTVTGSYLIDSALAGDWDTFHDAAAHMVLPSIVLAAATIGLITRTTRASVLESIQQDYVRMGRAKGLRESRVILRHVLPNALVPVVTLGGLAYANLLTGAVLTETVFSWPGLGRYTFLSASALDFPAIMAVTLLVAITYLVINLITDVSYALLDPKDPAMSAAVADAPGAARWRRLRSQYAMAALGAAIIVFWILVALFAPLLAPHEPNAVDLTLRLRPPGGQYPLGTDELGRDVLSRLIFGTRISLLTGVVVVAIGAAIGTLIGAVAAYAGGLAEEAIMRFTDLVLCFPPIILALAIGAALGIGTVNTIIAMLVVWWPKFARLARSLVLQQRSLEYVEAALVAGYGPGRILARHIVPNAVGPLIVLVTLDVGNAIIIFSGLSFLGLGVVPPAAEWGSMISEGRELVAQWWVASFPGFAILSIVLGFNFLGDGVRDWLDPRSRRF